MEQKTKRFDVRLITLGDSSVGKTCLITRYVDEKFSTSYLATIGLDAKSKIIKRENGDEIKINIFDTAGQERFRSISSNYIRNADGILLVYDITEKDTFEGVKQWVQKLNNENEDNKPILLIGKKIDLEDQRQVNYKEGEELAKTIGDGIKFYETSCKTGENVEEAINDLIKQIYEKSKGIEPVEIISSINIRIMPKNRGKKKKSFC